MKDIRIFLEYRTVNEVKIKCSQTGEEINPEYTVYDETSLNSVISRYKQNKEQFKDLSIFSNIYFLIWIYLNWDINLRRNTYGYKKSTSCFK